MPEVKGCIAMHEMMPGWPPSLLSGGMHGDTGKGNREILKPTVTVIVSVVR